MALHTIQRPIVSHIAQFCCWKKGEDEQEPRKEEGEKKREKEKERERGRHRQHRYWAPPQPSTKAANHNSTTEASATVVSTTRASSVEFVLLTWWLGHSVSPSRPKSNCNCSAECRLRNRLSRFATLRDYSIATKSPQEVVIATRSNIGLYSATGTTRSEGNILILFFARVRCLRCGWFIANNDQSQGLKVQVAKVYELTWQRMDSGQPMDIFEEGLSFFTRVENYCGCVKYRIMIT